MRGETVDRGAGAQRPNAHAAIGAAAYEKTAAELQLTDEGGVTLEDGDALAARDRLARRKKDLPSEGSISTAQKEPTYPSSTLQTLTLVSKLPVAILRPSNAIAYI